MPNNLMTGSAPAAPAASATPPYMPLQNDQSIPYSNSQQSSETVKKETALDKIKKLLKSNEQPLSDNFLQMVAENLEEIYKNAKKEIGNNPAKASRYISELIDILKKLTSLDSEAPDHLAKNAETLRQVAAAAIIKTKTYQDELEEKSTEDRDLEVYAAIGREFGHGIMLDALTLATTSDLSKLEESYEKRVEQLRANKKKFEDKKIDINGKIKQYEKQGYKFQYEIPNTGSVVSIDITRPSQNMGSICDAVSDFISPIPNYSDSDIEIEIPERDIAAINSQIAGFVDQMMLDNGFGAAKEFAIGLSSRGHYQAASYLAKVVGGDAVDGYGFLFEHLSKKDRKKAAQDIKKQALDKYGESMLPSAHGVDGFSILPTDEVNIAQKNPEALIEKFEEELKDKGEINRKLALFISSHKLSKAEKSDLTLTAAAGGYFLASKTYAKTLPDDEVEKYNEEIQALISMHKLRIKVEKEEEGEEKSFIRKALLTIVAASLFALEKLRRVKESAKKKAEEERKEQEEKEREKLKERKEREREREREKKLGQNAKDRSEQENMYNGFKEKYSEKELENYFEENHLPKIFEIRNLLKKRFDHKFAYVKKMMENDNDLQKLKSSQKSDWSQCEGVSSRIASHRKKITFYQNIVAAIFKSDLKLITTDNEEQKLMLIDAKAIVSAENIKDRNTKLQQFFTKYSNILKKDLEAIERDLASLKTIEGACETESQLRKPFAKSSSTIIPDGVDLKKSAVYKLLGSELDKYEARDVKSSEYETSPSQAASQAGAASSSGQNEASSPQQRFAVGSHDSESSSATATTGSTAKQKTSQRPSKKTTQQQPSLEKSKTSDTKQDIIKQASTNPFFMTALYGLRSLKSAQIDDAMSPEKKREVLWDLYRSCGSLALCQSGERNHDPQKNQHFSINPLSYNNDTNQRAISKDEQNLLNEMRNNLRHQVLNADYIEIEALKIVVQNILEYLPHLERIAQGETIFIEFAENKNPIEFANQILYSALAAVEGQRTADVEKSEAEKRIYELLIQAKETKNFKSKMWVCNMITHLIQESELDTTIKDPNFKIVSRGLGHSYAGRHFVTQFDDEQHKTQINQHKRHDSGFKDTDLNPVSEEDMEKFLTLVESKFAPTRQPSNSRAVAAAAAAEKASSGGISNFLHE